MKFMSFNIQFGVGLDGICNPARIADTIRGADIVALQEVTVNFPKNDHIDMPGIFAEFLPDFFPAFGAAADTDAGSAIIDGVARTRRQQFGNMILSRYPILSLRNLLLPRSRTYGDLNLQRAALEALLATPQGPIRVYSVHLDHRSPDERINQIHVLKDRIGLYGVEGGAVTGGANFGFPDLPHTDDYIVMGDFNMMPESQEYIAMAGSNDVYYGRTPRATAPTDAHALLGKNTPGSYTWEEPGRTDVKQYLDYCFVSASLCGRLKDAGIDGDCTASDHKPVWVEI